MVKSKRNIKGLDTGHSVKLAILFSLLVGGLIFLSLIAKFVIVVKNSSFDGEHRFTIVFPHGTNATSILSFSPGEQSVSLLRVNGVGNVATVGKTLEIPVDAQVQSVIASGKDIPHTLGAMLLRYPTLKTNLTIIDLARLWWFANQLPRHAFSEEVLSIENKEEISDATVDRLSAELFADATIANEKISIQIVNAAGVGGLGSRFARLVGNMGGNVVAVATSDADSEKTTIRFSGKKTYTLTRLEKTLGVTSTPLPEPGIADIIVTLGKDRGNATAF